MQAVVHVCWGIMTDAALGVGKPPVHVPWAQFPVPPWNVGHENGAMTIGSGPPPIWLSVHRIFPGQFE